MNQPSPPHFRGKEALEHLIEARRKGQLATEETHGAELPGHLLAGVDALKDTALFLLLFGILFPAREPMVCLPFLAGWLLWKVGRSALLGWSRLERLHRVIEEERWEIEHHRAQEKEELIAMYQAKGFSGKLLDEAVEVLMADDNRLLQVMLEEELGLPLESYEHPLKQALGAGVGVVLGALPLLVAFLYLPIYGVIALAALFIGCAAAFAAKREKNRPLPAFVWNGATSLLAGSAAQALFELLGPK